MTAPAPDRTQETAARLAGLFYLLCFGPALFAEFTVADQLISTDAAQTAQNIIAHERLFRLGAAANLLAAVIDVGLVTSLYVALRPVNRGLALAALLFRLIETVMLVVVVFYDLEALRLLSGANYLHGLGPEQLQSMARLAIAGHGAAYNLALAMFAFGSAIFGWLWLRSRYIPWPLAVLCLVASAWVGVCIWTVIVFPELRTTLSVEVYGEPIFLFELFGGLWLLIRGIASRGPVRRA